jgi:hypothetical protein
MTYMSARDTLDGLAKVIMKEHRNERNSGNLPGGRWSTDTSELLLKSGSSLGGHTVPDPPNRSQTTSHRSPTASAKSMKILRFQKKLPKADLKSQQIFTSFPKNVSVIFHRKLPFT